MDGYANAVEALRGDGFVDERPAQPSRADGFRRGGKALVEASDSDDSVYTAQTRGLRSGSGGGSCRVR